MDVRFARDVPYAEAGHPFHGEDLLHGFVEALAVASVVVHPDEGGAHRARDLIGIDAEREAVA